jgi:hypothetical protein
MCWNKEVSLITFIVALAGCSYLYRRNGPNDRYIAVFGVVIAMMQIAEFFMWIDQSCGKINMYASMFAIFILLVQPLVNMFCGIFLSDTPNKNILTIMVGLYIIFVAYLFILNYNQTINYCGVSDCKHNNSCNLEWKFIDTINSNQIFIWMIFLLMPALFMIPHYQGFVLLIIGLGTYLLSRRYNDTVVGSLWCWLVVFIIYIKILM